MFGETIANLAHDGRHFLRYRRLIRFRQIPSFLVGIVPPIGDGLVLLRKIFCQRIVDNRQSCSGFRIGKFVQLLQVFKYLLAILMNALLKLFDLSRVLQHHNIFFLPDAIEEGEFEGLRDLAASYRPIEHGFHAVIEACEFGNTDPASGSRKQDDGSKGSSELEFDRNTDAFCLFCFLVLA